MVSEEDWLFRPVIRKLCRYESIINGDLGLEDVATMNELIDIDDENRLRLMKAKP